jgi:hypothetical protein
VVVDELCVDPEIDADTCGQEILKWQFEVVTYKVFDD